MAASHRTLFRDFLTMILVVFGFMAFALAMNYLQGCGQRRFDPSPRSPDASQRVVADAQAWASASPGRSWSYVKPTGSMEPFINEHSLVLLSAYHGGVLPLGSVVEYNRGDTDSVLHVVVDEKGDSVYLSGFANHDSDGWFAKSTIHSVLCGQLYLP